MDCFVAALLAMTVPISNATSSNATSRPRGAMRPSRAFIFRPQGGRGECRVPAAPAVSCTLVVVERTRVTTSTPESPGIPARNGFNSLCRALPGDRALLPPSPRGYRFVTARLGRLKLRVGCFRSFVLVVCFRSCRGWKSVRHSTMCKIAHRE
jgi:hypothetical protein